jgi:hypothetical protein
MLPLLTGSAFSQAAWKHGRLEISANGHYLQYSDGTPFFWLGDTGWDLFQKLNYSQIRAYLNNRAAKGINVIQAVALPEPDGLRQRNRLGQIPLINLDPRQPNEKYFILIDSTIHMAAARQMFIGLLPTWGDKVSKIWGVGPVVFDTANAYDYGKWLGNRYKDEPNIIWIMGGDRPGFTDSMDWRPVWRAMIRGVREGTSGRALITYHPWGEHSSSEFWEGERVLDINMMQSGHARHDFDVWDMIQKDFDKVPPKPVLDGEPNYEDHPVDWDPKKGYFRAYDVRKQLYRSVFSGGCGVTYGHNSIFQFYGPGDQKRNYADRYWTEALDRPGAFQAGYLKKLILSRPCLRRLPDQTILKSGQGKDNAGHIIAFKDSENKYAMVYLPIGKRVSVDVSWMDTNKIIGWWFDPRTGRAKKIGVFNRKDTLWFDPPSQGDGNDWVLVLDDVTSKWPAPGTVSQ